MARALVSSQGIGKSKGHNTPFKGTVMSTEGGFPLITFLNPDKMVSMLEINFSKESSLAMTVKEIRDAGKWVMSLILIFYLILFYFYSS